MIKFTLLLLISSTFYQYTAQDTVNITLYYDAQRIGCEAFITKRLYPAYQRLKDRLVIDLVPYGSASRKLVDGKWEFICRGGPKECLADRRDGCVLKHYPNTSTRLNFFRCLLFTFDPTSRLNGEICAQVENIDWNKIMQCVDGPESDEIMLQNAIRTEALKGIQYVPWVVTNGNQDEDLQAAIRDKLMETVCDMFKVKPTPCIDKLY